MLAFLRLFLKFYLGGYATPTKCVAFWRLALNSYIIFMLISGRIVGVRSTEQSVGIKVGGF